MSVVNDTRRRKGSICLAAGIAVSSLLGAAVNIARAQSSVYFSTTGNFSNPTGGSQDFNFTAVRPSNPLVLATWSWGGGTNNAGEEINNGGIDSILTLYAANNTQIARNDDANDYSTWRDSLLTPGAIGTSRLDPVAPGDYRLRLTNYDTAINNGQWSTDLVNANGPMVMHASIGAGGSTLRTLTFGGSGTNIATLSLRNGESLTASNKLNMRHNAIVEIAGGALTGGTELIGVSGGPNTGSINPFVFHNSGTHTVTGNLYVGYDAPATYYLNGGTLTERAHLGGETIGEFSSGTFVQNGGVHSGQPNTLTLGNSTGSFGEYQLNAGTLLISAVDVGVYGGGAIDQAGGFAQLGAVSLAAGGGATGRYTMTGGTLNCTSLALANDEGASLAMMSVRPGAVASVNGAVTLNPGALLGLLGGTLSVGTLDTVGVPARFSFGSGTLNFQNDFRIGHLSSFDANVVVGTNQMVAVVGTTTLDPGAHLTIDGGTFATGAIVRASTAAITVGSGTLHLTGPAGASVGDATGGGLGGTFNIAGGCLRVNQQLNVSAAGKLNVSGGTLIVGSASNAGKINLTDSTANFGTGLANAGTVNLLDSTLVGSLNGTIGSTLSAGGRSSIAPGAARASKTDRLSIASGGNLDVNDNSLIVGSATARATVEAFVRTGRSAGSWDGEGLISKRAKNQPHHATSLGVLSGGEFTSFGGNGTFDGRSYSETDTLVRYTWYGDTDFNGVVNFDDYARIDAGFNAHLSGWSHGDFDLNGVVNFDDYALIDLAFNTQSLGGLRAVPEPAVACLLGAGLLLTRRRRDR